MCITRLAPVRWLQLRSNRIAGSPISVHGERARGVRDQEQFMKPIVIRSITLLAVMRLLLSQATITLGQQAPARIKIDVDRTIGEVDPLLFGNFSEHLGRMIYGGIFEEGSPLSDANGYRKDVMGAVKTLNVSLL